VKCQITTAFTLAAALIATFTIAANGETFPETLSQPGDPTRWYEPADTPAKKFRTQMKEAGAALKEQLEECRGSSNRRACEEEARELYRTEVARVRALFATTERG